VPGRKLLGVGTKGYPPGNIIVFVVMGVSSLNLTGFVYTTVVDPLGPMPGIIKG